MWRQAAGKSGDSAVSVERISKRIWSNQANSVFSTVRPVICPHLSPLCPDTYRLQLGVGSPSRRHWLELGWEAGRGRSG